MLAELTLLLNELLEPTAARGPSARTAAPKDDADHYRTVIVVTGLASPGKARLIDSLRERLAGTGVVVESKRARGDEVLALCVHAETDLEALVEGAPVAPRAARDADLIVPVDWEATSRSVARIVEWLIGRGIVAPEV
jgi:nicotinamide riboside kinase